MKKILTILLLLFITGMAFSQEEDFFSDDISFDDMDSLFSDDEEFIEVVEDKSDEVAEPSSELLTTEGVEFGGSITSSITAGVSYEKYPSLKGLIDDDKYKESFSPELSGSLHFNARPKNDIRFFGKIITSVPFYNSANVMMENSYYPMFGEEAVLTEVQVPKIEVYELFTDFNYDNTLFFKVGKQNAKWGVGYFFSPADFLSVATLDPENPEADREGPIAIKMNKPFGLNNLYMYVSVPNTIFTDKDASVSDLILAPQFQMLLGDTEISTGLFYQKSLAPKAMLAATYSTNNVVGKFSLFGEAVGMYGSDKKFIQDITTAKKYDEKFFFNLTAGFIWNKEIKENNFTLAAQYLFNGEGYDKEDDAIDVIKSEADVTSLVLNETVTIKDLMNRHKHYMAANFGISNLFNNEDLSTNTFVMMNLVDISGFIKPSVSYEFFDYASVSVGANFNLSDKGDEFYSDRIAYEITLNIGGGSF